MHELLNPDLYSNGLKTLETEAFHRPQIPLIFPKLGKTRSPLPLLGKTILKYFADIFTFPLSVKKNKKNFLHYAC